MNREEWTNWSGSIRCRPAQIASPRDDDSLASLVRQAADQKRTVRALGSGHSSSPLVPTEDLLVSLDRLSGIESIDVDRREAWVRAGTKLEDLGELLLKHQLVLHNLGDVDVQSIAGALSTGTHGTGRDLKILADALIGVRLVTGAGTVAEFREESDPAVIKAARVSLGALGVFTAVRLRLLPAFRLRLREWCSHIDDCMSHLEELVSTYRNFDFYWYPRRDEARLRTWNPPDCDSEDLPYASCIHDETDWSARVLPRHSHITRKFEEMEYALPAEAGPECFAEVRNRVKARHRKWVCWRVLYRTIAADEAFLSHSFQRSTVTISLHQNASLPYREYFEDLEPVFLSHGGRPHWGKKHNVPARELSARYPEWDQFCRIRRQLDPDGVFLNDHLRTLFAGD